MPLFDELAAGSSKLINSAGETVNILEHVSNGILTIDSDHHRIHEGSFFETSTQKSMSSGGTYDISISTPATGYIHFRPGKISCSADKLTIDFYEGNSMTAGATVSPYNRNRIVTAAATAIVIVSATITALGTLINKTFIGGGADPGAGASKSGGEISELNEWVLAKGTNYNIRFSNGSSASNTVNINLLWYEANAT